MVREGIGMNITLYVIIPNSFTLFFNASDNTSQLIDGNGKIDRGVLERKRKEIYSLPSARGVNEIPNITQLLRQEGYVNPCC